MLGPAVRRTRPPTPTVPPPAVADHPATPTADAATDPPPRRVPTDKTHPDQVKLPKISLAHFRGSLMRWTASVDSFNSAVMRLQDWLYLLLKN